MVIMEVDDGGVRELCREKEEKILLDRDKIK